MRGTASPAGTRRAGRGMPLNTSNSRAPSCSSKVVPAPHDSGSPSERTVRVCPSTRRQRSPSPVKSSERCAYRPRISTGPARPAPARGAPRTPVLVERRDDPHAAVGPDRRRRTRRCSRGPRAVRCARAGRRTSRRSVSSPPPSPENSNTKITFPLRRPSHSEAPVWPGVGSKVDRTPRAGLAARPEPAVLAEHAHTRVLVDRLAVAAAPRLRRGRRQTENHEEQQRETGHFPTVTATRGAVNRAPTPNLRRPPRRRVSPRAKTMPSTRPWASSTGAPESPGLDRRGEFERGSRWPAIDAVTRRRTGAESVTASPSRGGPGPRPRCRC